MEDNIDNVSEITIDYNPKFKMSELPVIKTTEMAYKALFKDWKELQHVESVKIMLLNRTLKLLGISLINKGGISQSIIDGRVIFQAALKGNADSIIIAHNHPSGNVAPSKEDIKMTEKLREAGKIIGIKVVDHIIITKESYFSFIDNDLIKN